jgi:hypothetical protein
MKPLVIEYPMSKCKDLNKALYNLLPNYFVNRLGGGEYPGGHRTNFNLHKQGIQEVNQLVEWIKSKLPEVAAYFAKLNPGEHCGFNEYGFQITNMWGILYNKGDCVRPHNHFPLTLSLSYYIKAPKGCSPLVIEKKKLKVKAGQCVFFLGSDWHGTKPEPVGGRCLIAANILYTRQKNERGGIANDS